MLRPINDSILVRQAPARTRGELIHLPFDARQFENVGLVEAVGPGAPCGDDTREPMSVEPGHIVVFRRQIGSALVQDRRGEERNVDVDRLVLRDDDMLAVIDEYNPKLVQKQWGFNGLVLFARRVQKKASPHAGYAWLCTQMEGRNPSDGLPKTDDFDATVIVVAVAIGEHPDSVRTGLSFQFARTYSMDGAWRKFDEAKFGTSPLSERNPYLTESGEFKPLRPTEVVFKLTPGERVEFPPPSDGEPGHEF